MYDQIDLAMKNLFVLIVLLATVFYGYGQDSTLKVNKDGFTAEDLWYYENEGSKIDSKTAFSFNSESDVIYLQDYDYAGSGTYKLNGKKIVIEINQEGIISRFEGLVDVDKLKLSRQLPSDKNDRDLLIYTLAKAPTPQVQMPGYIEITDEEELEEEIEVEVDDDMLQDDDFEFPEDNESRENEEFYSIVEVPAKPAEGYEIFKKYLNREMKYPEAAKRMEIEGVVFVEFVVEKNGEISQVNSLRGIGAGCDAEAERLIREMPKWQPATHKGELVRHRNIIPVHFKIEEKK